MTLKVTAIKMKKIYLILGFLSLFSIARAQDDNQPDDKKLQDIEALKVAFISKELNLTPEEAQKFWPVYNQYSKEMNATLQDKSNPDVIEQEEKVVNIRKRYRDQFTKLLGPDRMNRMFNAEANFRKLLIRALKRQRQKANLNRPFRNRD